MTNFEDVGAFHAKFGLHAVEDQNAPHKYVGTGAGPTGLEKDPNLMAFRIKFLYEELQEFEEGYADRDIAQMADALVDLVYVALGTAHFLGIPWEVLWADVQRANMAKERAAADGSNSKRGSSFDVIKPAGWIPPQTEELLKQYGFDTK